MSADRKTTRNGQTMRAQRFDLQLPLRYRSAGDPTWHEGRTENISSTGVLFRGEELLQVETPIELRVILPIGATKTGHPEVFCHGRIVRTVPRTPADARPGLAASINDYQFDRVQT